VAKKKETARDRWLKRHKEIRFYLTEEEYKELEKIASKYNMLVKDYLVMVAKDKRVHQLYDIEIAREEARKKIEERLKQLDASLLRLLLGL